MNKKSDARKKRDPVGVRADILQKATKAFASGGLSGTRIDEITALTKTSKRMIYYYFGDKEGLYQSCLEASYAEVRQGEEQLDLKGMRPEDALARLVSFTFDHHREHPDFIRLVMIENIHHATYMTRSDAIQSRNTAAIENLADIIARGQASGDFRQDLDPVALHWQISALSFFNVSNRPTFSALFGETLFSETGQSNLRDQTVDMILSHVRNTKRGAA